MPRGALLTGPPGTGKTYIAKVLASESQVPFFYVSGSEFIEKYVGVGAHKVRELFHQARKQQPCVVFIDEIDSIGKRRDDSLSHDEMQNTLNQLLVELDGFQSKDQVIVLGSTNMPELLNPTLFRPGRLDKVIDFHLPSLDEREEIISYYLRKITLNENQSFLETCQRLAELTPGFSSADLKNILNESAIVAV